MPLLSFSSGSSVTVLCSSGKILADRHHPGSMAEQLAIGIVMRLSPRHAARRHSGHRRSHRTLAAVEFIGVTSHKVTRRISLVELLAPDAISWTTIAIQRGIKITVNLGIGMEHEILADQPA